MSATSMQKFLLLLICTLELSSTSHCMTQQYANKHNALCDEELPSSYLCDEAFKLHVIGLQVL